MAKKQKPSPASPDKRLGAQGKRTGWGPFSAVLVTLGIYFGAQTLAALSFGIYALQQNVDQQLLITLIEDSVVAQFIFILLVEALSVYFLWLFMGRRNISWADIGLSRPKTKNLLYAIPGFITYFFILLVALRVADILFPGVDMDQQQQIGFDTAVSGLELTLVFASLVLLPALVEEILIRGFLYGGLIKKYTKLAAALIASIIFAVAHLQIGSGESLLWVAAIDTFVLSMVLIWLRERTGNIWSGVIVHLVKNGLAFITLFVLKLG